jgi:hypothetical protein
MRENKLIFLIKELWFDWMENRDVHGYKTKGYVLTKKEAEEICSKGKIFTKKDCWSLDDNPQFIYEEIKEFER